MNTLTSKTECIEDDKLDKHLKKTTLLSNLFSLIIALLTAISICYGFYYKTNDTLSDHTIQINQTTQDLRALSNAVNETKVFQGVSKEQMKGFEDKLSTVNKTNERIEDKIDRLLLERRR